MTDLDRESWMVFSGIVPHPPIMVPEVGRTSISEVRSSIDAMQTFTRRLLKSGAETMVLISPHAPLEADAFVAYGGPGVRGGFENFGAPQTSFQLGIDQELLSQIRAAAVKSKYELRILSDQELDHGSAVPLYFLLKNGWRGKVVILGYCFLSTDDHIRFGEVIRSAVEGMRRPAAFVASGDLSHRLKPNAPAGFNPNAHIFDDQVVAALNANEPQRILEIDPALRKVAGECGYRSMLTVIGATRSLPQSCEVLSYEGPFGVGYLVAQLTTASASTNGVHDDEELALEVTSIARRTVESFVSTGDYSRVPTASAWLLQPAPCFVSLKTFEGELRGCIGTIEPTKDSLAEEIAVNAVSAASHDPRFPPVTVSELDGLRYSVDVLLPAEPATLDELDPTIYGVIVQEANGSRRGLLLPDIPGIQDASQQVEIATAKAGIRKGSPVQISRFKVRRFREKNFGT